jgi:nucleoid-associated protein YgaU
MDDMFGLIPAIQSALAAAGFSDVSVSTNAEGQLLVEGSVPDAETEQMVMDLVASAGVEDAEFMLAWTEQETWGDSELSDEESAAAAAAAAAAYDFSGDEEETTYTVERGDSYWKIAVMFYGKGKGKYYTQIQEANGGAEVIHPGDVLVIPPLQED